MKTIATALACACMALGAASVSAQESVKKDGPMPQGAMKEMTMQECKDHMAMSKTMTPKSEEISKLDETCAAMMEKEGGTMMKDGADADPSANKDKVNGPNKN